MKAVILAAGKGERLRPLTLKTPKPLLKINGKTFLERIIDVLSSSVSEIIIVIGYKGGQIKKFFGTKYKNRKIRYVVQKKLNGTGSALLLTEKYFKEKERFLILNADELLTKKEIKDCLSHKFSWLSRRVKNPEQFAVAIISKKGKIIGVIENPKKSSSDIVAAVAGMVVVNSGIFKYRPAKGRKGEYRVESMMNEFIKDHDVFAVFGENKVENISPRNLKELDKLDKKLRIQARK